MGAVQKLATVVIVGLVALATLVVVYLAGEPDRRASETTEQNMLAIERGTDLYITYCLQCHGPAGLGSLGQEETTRIGAPLNQSTFTEQQLEGARAVYQSDDPVQQGIAEDWARFRIIYGVPAEPTETDKRMPAFGNDLNVQEINDLVYLIMNADWDYVYNQAVHDTGIAVAEAECAENPDGEYCGDTSEAPPVYPTPPPPADAAEDEPSRDTESAAAEAAESGEADPGSTGAEPAEGSPEAGSEGEEAAESGAAVTLEARDPAEFSETALTVAPGDTIEMTNTGVLQHDFTVDELGIHEVTPGTGDTVTITIPEDAEAGEYEFYCSVPGHRELGMVGTLTIEAP